MFPHFKSTPTNDQILNHLFNEENNLMDIWFGIVSRKKVSSSFWKIEAVIEKSKNVKDI